MTFEIRDNEPIVMLLDRSASMLTRDCADGMTRWDYALKAIAECFTDQHSGLHRNPLTLITFGVETTVYAHPPLSMPLYGEAGSATGRAMIEALYALPGDLTDDWGKIICITDGLPTRDSRAGIMFLRPFVRRVYEQRVMMLSVGQKSRHPSFRGWLESWPNFDSLEHVIEASTRLDIVLPPTSPEAEPAAQDGDGPAPALVDDSTLAPIADDAAAVLAQTEDEVTLVLDALASPPGDGPDPDALSLAEALPVQPSSADAEPTVAAAVEPRIDALGPPTVESQNPASAEPPRRESSRQGSKSTTQPPPRRKA